ncbi:MAG: hypothetical protein AB2L20_09440 [Mangrovibacterium sp.]
MKLFIASLWFFLFTAVSFVNAQDIKSVPYTLDDRDRAIRTEARIDALDAKFDARINVLEEKTDIRFEAVNSRIDYIFWLLGVIVALILFTLGYTIWDRRTALKPAFILKTLGLL